ncbi:MAG: hypothetical protein JST91_08680 [Actinobacteria bacterium]|nr:hypothetical protein [Actinomycetota bacterium]
MKKAVLGLVLAAAALVVAPDARAAPLYGNFELRIPDRYDFHTWAWAIRTCVSNAEDCVFVNSIPMPIAKAYEYRSEAYLADGRYTLTVDVPDGLRCGNVYYGPIIPTRDVYTWDAVTLQGTLESSFAAGCDGAPGGTFTYPFTLVRL